MLGVIIGVGAVIALVSIGQGATARVSKDIASLGSNLIFITPMRNARLTVEDAEDLPKRVPTISAAVPSISVAGTVKWRSSHTDTTIEGVTPSFLEVRDFSVERGRFISDEDVSGRRRVAVLGRTVVNRLFGDAGLVSIDPVGQTVTVSGQVFTVAGILAPKGASMGRDYDDTIVVPVTAAQRLAGNAWVNVVYARARSTDVARLATSHITELYRRKFPPIDGRDQVIVTSQDQVLSTIDQMTRTLTLMLGLIAGVSLIVGGIGIMNIMLVSVTERTREIGIRKALGATRRDILLQFLVESIVLSCLGGLFGIILGMSGSFAIARFAQWTTVVSPSAIATAFLFASLVGLFFGVYPAARAANLHPIEALRYE
ncbi:MAG: FtsX-like permease family protein [Firmicutes bacterium]|nr:FtsX-like permease family protein [Bacillota bacterium]